MFFSIFDQNRQDDILVFIEEFDSLNGEVVFDFIDSNELNTFLSIINRQRGIDDASMFHVKNYFQKKIQENTIYIIKRTFFQQYLEYIEFVENSYIIGYKITLPDNADDLFYKSKTLNAEENYLRNVSIESTGEIGLIPSIIGNDLKINVRYVGQGNWNEIITNNNVKVAFDLGASKNASFSEVTKIIGNKDLEYLKHSPGIVISHWDIDHYHCLKGFSDKTLSNLSFFICRSILPTLTSRTIFSKIRQLLPSNRFFSIPPSPKLAPNKPALTPLSYLGNQLLFFNGHEHKDRNVSGIVIVVKNQLSSVVLSGDCHYSQISEFIIPNIDTNHSHHLVVPHHGGKAGKFKYDFKNLRLGKAVISVGKNTYGHPLHDVKDSLRKIKFNTLQTNHVGKDIIIDLN